MTIQTVEAWNHGVHRDFTDVVIFGLIDVMTATIILSEVGWDMSKWATEDHFVSWLRLCPDNRISGDRIIGKGRLRTNNRVTIALKMAACTLRLSNTYLGAQFRRLRTKLGGPIAIKAMAAKLARLVYRMPRKLSLLCEAASREMHGACL